MNKNRYKNLTDKTATSYQTLNDNELRNIVDAVIVSKEYIDFPNQCRVDVYNIDKTVNKQGCSLLGTLFKGISGDIYCLIQETRYGMKKRPLCQPFSYPANEYGNSTYSEMYKATLSLYNQMQQVMKYNIVRDSLKRVLASLECAAIEDYEDISLTTLGG